MYYEKIHSVKNNKNYKIQIQLLIGDIQVGMEKMERQFWGCCKGIQVGVGK